MPRRDHSASLLCTPIFVPAQAYSVLKRVFAGEADQARVDAAKLLVFLNLSFTYLKLERPARALTYGEKALELDQKNAKALFRCGQVRPCWVLLFPACGVWQRGREEAAWWMLPTDLSDSPWAT